MNRLALRDASSTAVPNPWLPLHNPTRSAGARLFCFPYAGGSAQVFRRWAGALGPTFDVCAVQPPGRWNRFTEPLISDLPTLVRSAQDGLREYLIEPFALYGHSVGALVAFEFARQLRRERLPEPAHIFVAARRAPHISSGLPAIDRLSDDQLLQLIAGRFDALPHVILQDRDLLSVLLPILRADLKLDESYSFEPDEALACPLTVLGGTADRTTTVAMLEAWGEYARGGVTVETIEGGHFFLEDARDAVLATITRRWRGGV